jgi:hypothetical protein
MNLKTEMEKTERGNECTGARRLRRFSIRNVFGGREPVARRPLKRPEARAPLTPRQAALAFGLNQVFSRMRKSE